MAGDGEVTVRGWFQRNYFKKEEKFGEILEKPADKGAGVVDTKFLFGR